MSERTAGANSLDALPGCAHEPLEIISAGAGAPQLQEAVSRQGRKEEGSGIMLCQPMGAEVCSRGIHEP